MPISGGGWFGLRSYNDYTVSWKDDNDTLLPAFLLRMQFGILKIVKSAARGSNKQCLIRMNDAMLGLVYFSDRIKTA